MKRVILILSMLLPTLGHAAPECLPGLYGPQFAGAKLAPLVRGNAGWYAYGWCRAADGSPSPVYLLCAHGECASDIGAEAGRAMATLGLQLLGSDPARVYGGWWDANPRAYDCGANGPPAGTPRGAACAELAALMERDKPAWSASAYRVKLNGVAIDRPAYTLSGGVRGTREVARAKVGEPCNTQRPTLTGTGTDLWAEFGPTTGVVALCAKQ